MAKKPKIIATHKNHNDRYRGVISLLLLALSARLPADAPKKTYIIEPGKMANMAQKLAQNEIAVTPAT
jgi:hypothetical protein